MLYIQVSERQRRLSEVWYPFSTAQLPPAWTFNCNKHGAECEPAVPAVPAVPARESQVDSGEAVCSPRAGVDSGLGGPVGSDLLQHPTPCTPTVNKPLFFFLLQDKSATLSVWYFLSPFLEKLWLTS